MSTLLLALVGAMMGYICAYYIVKLTNYAGYKYRVLRLKRHLKKNAPELNKMLDEVIDSVFNHIEKEEKMYEPVKRKRGRPRKS